MTTEHELHGFFRSYSRKLAEDYAATRPRVLEDPGTSGDQGEESWANLLRDWLPEGYSVVTKGRILGASGKASPQVDVIVLKPNYPKFLKGQKYYFLDGVAAAFECKLTLKSEHLEKLMKNAKLIAELQPKKSGSPQKEIMAPLVYGVLAHSHAWKSDKDSVVKSITEKLHEFGKIASEPRELPELVCIADLAGWRLSHAQYTHYGFVDVITPDPAMRNALARAVVDRYQNIPTRVANMGDSIQLFIDQPYSQYNPQYYPEHIDSNTPTDSWVRFTPVGAFIAALYDKLAYRDPGLLNISEYFQSVHVPASSGCIGPDFPKVPWPRNIISDETWADTWGGNRPKGSEWRWIFF